MAVVPPPLLDGRDTAFSVCIYCAISMSTRAGGSSNLGRTGLVKPDAIASAVGIPWSFIVVVVLTTSQHLLKLSSISIMSWLNNEPTIVGRTYISY